MQSMKETAANIAASAKSGLEKTKATMQEKVERMSANDPERKEMATQKKEGRHAEAEWNKQDAREHNAAARQAASATGGQGCYTTGGSYGSGGCGPDAYGSSGIGGGMDTYSQSGGQGRYTTSGPYGAGGGADAYSRGGIGSGMETYSHSTTGATGQRLGTHQMSAMPGHGTGQSYVGLEEEGAVRTRPTGMPGETTGHNTHVEATGYGTENTGTRSNVGSGFGTGGSY